MQVDASAQDRNIRRGDEFTPKRADPVRIDNAVVIGESDHGSLALLYSAIARERQPLAGFQNVPHREQGSTGRVGDNRFRVVAGIIIDDNDFHYGVAARGGGANMRQGLCQQLGAIVGTKNNANVYSAVGHYSANRKPHATCPDLLVALI